MEILILGGTQFVGKHLVFESLKRNHNVTLFNRGISNPNLFSDVDYIIGDRNKSEDLMNLKNKQWDVVIDVPHFQPDIVKKSIDILFDNVKRYVFISTMSVYDVEISDMMESYDKSYQGWYSEYCKDKLECERLFIGKELKSLIFRPGIICGDGDNTNRFDYREDGIFFKDTNNLLIDYHNYHTAFEFSSYVLDLIETGTRGIYEVI